MEWVKEFQNLFICWNQLLVAEIFNKNKSGTTKKDLSNFKILVTVTSLLKYIDNIKMVDFEQKLLMTVKM